MAATGGAPFILRAQTGVPRARVKIDTDRAISDIDPKLYGNFVEHLGRCVDGGVFRGEDRSSPTPTATAET